LGVESLNSASQKIFLPVEHGQLEVMKDVALSIPDSNDGLAKGMAVLSHPHPLHGGTMDNKVVQTMARAFTQAGWDVLRFNFRGVGQSSGVYDNALGELDDLLSVIAQMAPTGRLALGGFSFGAMITAKAVGQLLPKRAIDRVVLVGLAVSRFEVPKLDVAMHHNTLLIHGQDDDVVPLADVMAWAQDPVMPVCVVPQTGHFFHGQLPLLKGLVMRHVM
jgi:alpha/beta superfamily hydrolase